jgi:hypothetical protein
MGAAVASAPTGRVPAGGVQGSFFQENSYPTFADTAPTPVVPGHQQTWEHSLPKPKGSLWLRIAVVLTALTLLAAAAVLGLVESGVIHINTNASQSGQGAAPAPAHTGSPAASKSSLVSATSLGNASANYTVNAKTFGLTIETSRPTWVQVGPVGQNPTFAGTLAPNSVKHFNSLGTTQVEVGAGGSTEVISANNRTEKLIPPTAPFTFQFTPR